MATSVFVGPSFFCVVTLCLTSSSSPLSWFVSSRCSLTRPVGALLLPRSPGPMSSVMCSFRVDAPGKFDLIHPSPIRPMEAFERRPPNRLECAPLVKFAWRRDAIFRPLLGRPRRPLSSTQKSIVRDVMCSNPPLLLAPVIPRPHSERDAT